MVWCKVLIKIDLLFVYFILISGIEAVLWYGHKNYSAILFTPSGGMEREASKLYTGAA